LASLDEDVRARGVCAASSGNHGQAVTLAAWLFGVPAVILMPEDAAALKRAATEAYGAEVVTFDRYRDDREALMRDLAAERGLALVHPYDNPAVMAG
jgi:threonine dehydratase